MKRFITINWALLCANMHSLIHMLNFKAEHRNVFELKTNMIRFPRKYVLIGCACGRIWHGKMSEDLKSLGWMKELIHSSIGVYANYSTPYVYNGVAEEDLKHHIWYNKTMRPSRALFINGKCVHRGSLSKERAELIKYELKADPHKPIKRSSIYK